MVIHDRKERWADADVVWRDPVGVAEERVPLRTAAAGGEGRPRSGIAWALAPHMPGVTDEYPYYAPLGALLSMYPTLMESAKSGVQTLLGPGLR
ncbi:hypothetical protein [Microbacterium sp. AK031]|uniref:hypothetical protein n=1 Tax=Microbacterium sp. AK031 TaxID=2723076 RepID=UPI0021695A77|nr:hypothetical protein [Microbacterium sp. AK031]MCS3843801.1 hypothetical protein [Microbacterium sp. AK031]